MSEARERGPDRELDDDTRQKAIDLLCEAFAEDRMSVEEFERRVEAVHELERVGGLRDLLSDLRPGTAAVETLGEEGDSPVPAARTVGSAHPTVPAERVGNQTVIAGIFGGGGRSGPWVPARTNWAVAVCGGLEIDFREARMPPGVTELRVTAVWGGMDVIVPPDIQIECSVAGILGGFDHNETVRPTDNPDAPVLRITGIAFMGGIEVTTRHPGESARDAKRRLKAARKERKRLEGGG